MVHALQKTVAAVVFLTCCGCAPWVAKPLASYVTVEADSHHNTEQSRKNYKAARKCMEKQLKGKECDYAKTEGLLRESLTHDVRFGPAHHSLGVVYLWQKKLYLAAWEFEYAARLMPDRFEPLNNLGLAYESVGKYEQAKSYYLLAREKSPNNPEVISNLARCCFRSGDSVAEMQTILEDVLATDSRPEWRCWAAEKLGLHIDSPPPLIPVPRDQQPPDASKPSLPLDSENSEELPLLNSPSPDAEPPSADSHGQQELQEVAGAFEK